MAHKQKFKAGDWVEIIETGDVHLVRAQDINDRLLLAGLGCSVPPALVHKLPASPAALAKWYRMLPGILKQLEAMNCSSAHAASWCEPRSQLTTNLIKRIRRIAKGQWKAKGGRGRE